MEENRLIIGFVILCIGQIVGLILIESFIYFSMLFGLGSIAIAVPLIGTSFNRGVTLDENN